jgi:hypothetical protein
LAAIAGAIVSSTVAGVIAWRQGKARGRAELLERFEDRLRRVELRSASTRAALRVERRKRERKGNAQAD